MLEMQRLLRTHVRELPVRGGVWGHFKARAGVPLAGCSSRVTLRPHVAGDTHKVIDDQGMR